MSQSLQQRNVPFSSTTVVRVVQDNPIRGGRQAVCLPDQSSNQGAEPPPISDPGSRSAKKPAPSPLQTSTSLMSAHLETTTPTRGTFKDNSPILSSTTVQTELSSIQPEALSHRRAPSLQESPDNRLASDTGVFGDQDKTPLSLSNGIDSRLKDSIKPPNDSVRSFSDPLSYKKAAEESIAYTQPPMASTVPAHRANMVGGPQRTSSIDSAISAISTGSTTQKLSQDSQSPAGPADIAKLVQAAGSPEAVIQYLLKEKQSQAAQNTQLWRLVDKQRAMILGLNKDLERALKDKERYRKKLKDVVAGDSAKSSLGQAADSSGIVVASHSRGTGSSASRDVEALPSPSLPGSRSIQGEHQSSPIDVALAPYPITPPADNPSAFPQPLPNLIEAEHKMPSSVDHAFQRYNPDSHEPEFDSTQQERKDEVVKELPYNASVLPSKAIAADPTSVKTGSTTLKSEPIPTISVGHSSPTIDLGKQFYPPPRKPPPAPLNLVRSPNARPQLRHSDSAEEVDSDFDDVLEVEEIPAYAERGRRRTREQDDKEREAAAIKDAELRSLSKKSKSRPNTPKADHPELSLEPIPQTARQAVQISPPDAQIWPMMPPDSVAGSLAGILSAESFAEKKPLEKTFILPLKSPGLPASPRPIDRGLSSPLPRNPRGNNPTSPLMSPRGMAAFSGMPLSPRAPRQPIPLPPNTPLSMASPRVGIFESQNFMSPQPLQIMKKKGQTPSGSKETSPTEGAVSDVNEIYKGFVTEEYPDLLLPPNALPSIDVRVTSSRLKPSRASLMFPSRLDDDPVFTLAVFSRSSGRELWRVQKDSLSLAQLDQSLKKSANFSAKVPEKSLFAGHAPAKIDARRVALDQYLDEILNTQMDVASALEVCRYLSTNTMEPHAEDAPAPPESKGESPVRKGPGGRPLKNGYLTKRGKNFGGWKARFFVLDGPVFKYYEAPGGAHLGVIKLQNAQIGKQQQSSEKGSPSRGDPDDVENQYRHAFLILEPKRKDSSSLVRHVLCAESDQERDQWVEALLQYVDYRDSDEEEKGHTHSESGGSSQQAGLIPNKKVYGQGKILNISEKGDSLRAISYEAATQGELPQGVTHRSRPSETPPPANGNDKDSLIQPSQSLSHSKSISAPQNGAVIQDSGAWGNKPSSLAPQDEKIKQKKRSFFGFGSKQRPSLEMQDQATESTSNLTQIHQEQHGQIRAVFGAPLADAVKYNPPRNVDVELPAVFYRCIEYLDSKNAAAEEGIFRLSGSNIVIKSLRERFNVEGDVDLVNDNQYYDIHAVASLLKLYLRELPTTILTRELHLDFVAVTELHDLQEKISALNSLVHKLPKANGALLRYLSSFLINIINHSDVNKMTVRNVGIVFSPTLNIPAPVFALFLQQFDSIFGESGQEQPIQFEVTVTAPPLTPEDIRSPRRQKFQELPTPSYNQTSFARGHRQNQAQPSHDQAFVGFTPLQPSYGNHGYSHQTVGGPEYGSLGSALAGSGYDQYSNSGGNLGQRQHNDEASNQSMKSKRRESSMFGLTKQPSYNKLTDDPRLVNEESYFEQ